MSEPTNNQLSPVVVGFGSVPGGTGCTTLATHAATFAARQGLHTLAISIDPSADMLRRLGSDERLIDGHWTKEKRLKLAFCPPEAALTNVVDYLPNLGFGGEVGNPEIIIVDLGPGQCPPLVYADYWVVPVMDARSLSSMEEQRFPQGNIKTLFVRSRVDCGHDIPTLRKIIRHISALPSGTSRLLDVEIPRSGLLRRTTSERKTIWELSMNSLTRTKMDWFCRELLGIVMPVHKLTSATEGERFDELLSQAGGLLEQSSRRSAEHTARRINSLLSSRGPVVEPPSDEEVRQALEDLVEKNSDLGVHGERFGSKRTERDGMKRGVRAVPQGSARKKRS